MAPKFRYKTGVALTEGAGPDGSTGVSFNRTPIGPKDSSDDSLYTHQDYPGRADESPAERTLREGMNDHGRALEQLQKGGAVQRDQYPLNEDGDEDK